MADEKYLKILEQGREIWNKFRIKNRSLEQIDLSDLDLSRANLRKINLKYVNLRRANLGFN